MADLKLNSEIRERLIQELKDCGQDLIDRAENFIGDNDCMTDLSIDIRFSIVGEEAPTITVSREYYPKPMLKRYFGLGSTEGGTTR